MVALAHLQGSALSSEKELEIWGFANNGSTSSPGSFPGRLALFARENGIHARLFENREKLAAIFHLSTEQNRFPGLDPVKALQEHDAYMKEAEEEGIPVERKPFTLADVANLAAEGPVLMMVSTASDVSGLHWVLLQKFDPITRLCTLMDPALGQNFTRPVDVFLHHYEFIHPFLGVAIALKRPSSRS